MKKHHKKTHSARPESGKPVPIGFASRIYMCTLSILGLGIGVVGFYYIDLLEKKHQTMSAIYEAEESIRELEQTRIELLNDCHALISIRRMDSVNRQLGLNLDHPVRIFDLSSDMQTVQLGRSKPAATFPKYENGEATAMAQSR